MAENYNSPDAVGKIVQVTGEAFAVTDSESRALAEGSEIFKGETLITKGGGAIEVLFRTTLPCPRGRTVKSGWIILCMMQMTLRALISCST